MTMNLANPLVRMTSTFNWDEFRLVKAIADSQSLVGAAERLGLNHSTVFRRLAAIEAAVGARLFERTRGGYQPTTLGEEMVALAAGMAESITEFERRSAGRDVKPTGELRITTMDVLALAVLPPILTKFREAHPCVQVEVIVSAHPLNLSRREADVAIRATNGPSESLVGRKICRMRWAIYGAHPLAARHPRDFFTCGPWVGFGEHQGFPRLRQWFDKHIDRHRQVCRVDTVNGMMELAAQGVGFCVLPCFLGDRRAELTRMTEPQDDLAVELWLLTHADLRHSARVRAFMDLAGGELVKLCRPFEGEACDSA